MLESVFNPQFLPELSLTALFLVLFFGTFISEDVACLAAGALAAQGRISFAFALAACFTGIVVGDMLLYGAGRLFGKQILETRFVSRFVSQTSVERGSAWLEKRGAAAVFLSRFVTGLRLPTYLAAGFLKTNFLKFTLYFIIAAAIWTPILIGTTAFAHRMIFPQNALIGTILLIIVLRLIWKLSSWKNRRHLIGRFRRSIKWEFWPLQIFYFPVVLYILFLGLKHRSLALFTCVNPAIPAGGFKGESKDAIYKGLLGNPKSAKHLPAYEVVSGSDTFETKLNAATRFLDEHRLSFPVVLKPNAGERGKDVMIVRNFDELREILRESSVDTIIQEFVDGVEAGIFYYRYPNEPKGHIFSITEKRFPEVIGDGQSTLEELILRDGRAACLAAKYFEQNSEKLGEIIGNGASVQIINIGTHSRGAIFAEGEWLRTRNLEAKIDEICRGFEGFFFGRFDVRASSFAELQNGEGFKIIELNGVTSESTNIYDPQYSLLDAYRILFRQWRIAFEIGAANHKLGAEPTSVSRLLGLVFFNSEKRAAHINVKGQMATAAK
ncbi:MAG: VTT domain-containing protein [Blastocatellia bacterium]